MRCLPVAPRGAPCPAERRPGCLSPRGQAPVFLRGQAPSGLQSKLMLRWRVNASHFS
ncbi:Uncharacterised protein [Bordetella pertussis]|nr:Uncharacterised protein [Bordetella pertussis]